MKKLAIALICLFLCVPSQARIITVDDDGPADFDNIQAAINDANNGDTIKVQPGIYTGNGNRDIDFLGKAITVRSTDPNDPNIVTDTVIDCQSSGRGFYFQSGEGPNSLLSGVTITNGNVSTIGGGIYCRYSSPTITDCRIIGNHAGEKGGGIFCRDGNATIRRCQVIGNTVHEDYNLTGKGAGIMVWGCSPLIENCIITNNSTTGTNGHGGGIHGRDGANPTIRNCLIFGNYAVNYGGGINNGYNASCIVESCTVADNTAGSQGGGINGNNAIITNSIVWNNSGTEIRGDFIEVSYSNIEGGFSGIGNIDQYPAYDSNYHLLSYSPCIDAGDPNFIPTYKETDVDGEARVMNSRIDMGADEYTSTPTPFLEVWPDSISFYAQDVNGSNPANKVLYIRNLGFGTLNWHAVEESVWLQIDPNNGSCTDETDLITLSVDINGLHEGAYQCELIISDPNSGNSPKVVNIDLRIGRAVIELNPSEFEFSFSQNRSTPIDKIMLVKNLGGEILNWNIETDCNWIIVEPNTGSTESLESNEVTISVTGIEIFEPGQYTCQVTVSDPCAFNSPQISDVTLYVTPEGQIYVPRLGLIQEGIDSAVNGDIVTVADGIFTGNGNRDMNFNGKAITLCSEIGPTNCIIDVEATESEPHGAFLFNSGEGPNSILHGFTITGGYMKFAYSGGEILVGCSSDVRPIISNCIFRDNLSPVFGGDGGSVSPGPELINCTFYNNSAPEDSGIIVAKYTPHDDESAIVVRNSILFENTPVEFDSIACCICGCGAIYADFSILKGTWQSGTPLIMNSCFLADPCFADPCSGDYHLKSQAGRWDPNSESWVTDSVTSLAIDTGDPNADWTAELWPHGKRINMGAYGGTPQASMSLSDAGNIADLDNDDSVNYADLMLLTDKWLYQEVLLSEDLDRNGEVDLTDFAILADNWLEDNSP